MNADDFLKLYGCRADGVELMRLALGAVVYFTSGLDEHRRGLGVLLDGAWDLVGSSTCSYQTTNMKKPKALKGKGREVLVQMLNLPPSPVFNYVCVDNRKQIDEAADWSIELASSGARGAGYFSLRLPPGTAHITALRDLCRQLISELRLAHGYAGYTLAYNRLSLKASVPERKFYAIGMRHLGIDLPSAANTSFVIDQGIKRVNWLTLIGTRLAAKLEGLNTLVQQPGIGVDEGSYGVVIQAGDAPVTGDSNLGDRCEMYGVVGRAVRAIRCRNHPAFIVDETGLMASAERTKTWLETLDDAE